MTERVVTGADARQLLQSPGAMFACLGYQYRVTDMSLECWGLDPAGAMDWLDVEHERERLALLPLSVLKEPTVYDAVTREALYIRAMVAFGVPSQMRMAQEECAELIASINRLDRERCSVQHVINEVADVVIMLEQVRRIVGPELVDRAVQVKLARLERTIAKAEKAQRQG